MSEATVVESLNEEDTIETISLEETLAVLASVPLLMVMELKERTSLVEKLRTLKFKHGDVIVAEGDKADCMYMMQSGASVVVVDGSNVHEYGRGDYFGERGLLCEEQRTATVKACGSAVCWKLERRDFEEVSGACGEGLLQHVAQMFLATVPLLMGMDSAQRTKLAAKLEMCKFEDNDTIIAEGDVADCMYIVESGTASEIVDSTGVLDFTRGDYFGDRGLMDNTPRTATMKACGTTACWKLGREAFEQVSSVCGDALRTHTLMRFLNTVPLLMAMKESERAELATSLELCQFRHDDIIIAEGEMADAMFIMESGSALVLVDGKNVLVYGDGDYFGERGLMLKEPRAGTVKACGKASCWKLNRAAFEKVVGTCGGALLQSSKQYGVVQSSWRTKLSRRRRRVKMAVPSSAMDDSPVPRGRPRAGTISTVSEDLEVGSLLMTNVVLNAFDAQNKTTWLSMFGVSAAVKYGWLEFETAEMTWQKAWFELKHGVIRIYEHRSLRGESPLIEVPLAAVSLREDTKTKRVDAPHAFRLDVVESRADLVWGPVILKHPAMRTKIVVKPQTAQMKAQWIQSIRLAKGTGNALDKPSTGATFAPYLTLLGISGVCPANKAMPSHHHPVCVRCYCNVMLTVNRRAAVACDN